MKKVHKINIHNSITYMNEVLEEHEIDVEDIINIETTAHGSFCIWYKK